MAGVFLIQLISRFDSCAPWPNAYAVDIQSAAAAILNTVSGVELPFANAANLTARSAFCSAVGSTVWADSEPGTEAANIHKPTSNDHRRFAYMPSAKASPG